MFLTSYALIQDHQLEWSNTGGYINAIPIKLYQCTKLKFGNLSTSWLMREQEELQVAKHRDENAKSKLLNFQRCFFKSRWWLRGPVGALLNILSDRQLEMIFNLFFTNGMNAPFFFLSKKLLRGLVSPSYFLHEDCCPTQIRIFKLDHSLWHPWRGQFDAWFKTWLC